MVLFTADISPPGVQNCPADISVKTTSPNGMRVFWEPPNVLTTNNNDITMINSHAPNDMFLIGEQLVIYVFRDTADRVAYCSFKVTVQKKGR